MSGYYPAGLNDYTPGCPWSEPVVPEKDFEITVSQTLSKGTTVTTTNYIPGAEGVDYDSDDEGGYCASGWHEPDDTSDTNWAEEYDESGHYTPLQLIKMFKRYLQEEIEGTDTLDHSPKHLEYIMEECEGWTEDETEYVEG